MTAGFPSGPAALISPAPTLREPCSSSPRGLVGACLQCSSLGVMGTLLLPPPLGVLPSSHPFCVCSASSGARPEYCQEDTHASESPVASILERVALTLARHRFPKVHHSSYCRATSGRGPPGYLQPEANCAEAPSETAQGVIHQRTPIPCAPGDTTGHRHKHVLCDPMAPSVTCLTVSQKHVPFDQRGLGVGAG